LAGAFLLYYFGFHLSASILLLSSLGVYLLTIQFSKKGFRELSSFLHALRYRDTSVSPTTSEHPKSLQDLFSTIREIRSDYRDLVKERDESLIILEEVVENVPIGILAIRQDGTLAVFNREGTKLLHTGSMKNLDRLKKIRPFFFKRVKAIPEGGSALCAYGKDEEENKLFIRKASIFVKKERVEVLIFHEMDAEYGQVEMRSWDKLLGILTHEIANSITAISSLSQSASELAKAEENLPEDLTRALDGVKRRSDKLFGFVSDYRSLAEVPKPQLEEVDLCLLMNTMAEEWSLHESRISIKVNCPTKLRVQADEGQLIHCFENFFLNSVHALEKTEKPAIHFYARPDEAGRVEIGFRDNGHGMEGDTDRAVVPFFTTRKEGKGVGLALARQIIRSHNGTLTARNASPGFEVLIRI